VRASTEIEAIVRATLAAHPLPDTIDELSAFERRRLDYRATANGALPEATFTAAIAERDAAKSFDSKAVAQEIRMQSW